MAAVGKQKFLLGIMFMMVCLAFAGIAAAQDGAHADTPPHWAYEGEAGPDHWGDLEADYATCSTGMQQSPVDILAPESQALTDIQFNYNPSALTIKNNGHTIQVDYAEGSSITVDGTEYLLKQFHFHHPSEHTIAAWSIPMEMHLVHADADGNLAVVGVLIKEGAADNAAFAPVWDNLPAEEVEPTVIDGATINAADLLPADRTYDTYSGSLTTPPCSENVKWLVLTTPIELSVEQIAAFSDIFELNARPVQPLNDRSVSADSGADS